MCKEVQKVKKQIRIATLMMLSLTILGCGCGEASDSTSVKKKVKVIKMKGEQAAKSIDHTERSDATSDTVSGSHGGLNSVDILSHPAAANGKQNRASEGSDQAKEEDQLDEYSKLHKEPPIGDATMDNDGTIRVRIRMMGGMHADGNVSYAKDSKHYDAVLKHLGGMKPGDVKLVPPWPDPEDTSQSK